MDFLIPIYNELKQLLEPSVALVIGILTIVITKNSDKSSAARERLELVYHPLFLGIEPHLYKNVVPCDVEDFLLLFDELESKYSLFIYPSLRYWIKKFRNNKNVNPNKHFRDEDSDWETICDYISKEYDKLCKLAYMPLRSTAYRMNNSQYKTKFSMYLGMIKLGLPALTLYTLLFALIFPQLVILGYFLIFMFLLNAFFDR